MPELLFSLRYVRKGLELAAACVFLVIVFHVRTFVLHVLKLAYPNPIVVELVLPRSSVWRIAPMGYSVVAARTLLSAREIAGARANGDFDSYARAVIDSQGFGLESLTRVLPLETCDAFVHVYLISGPHQTNQAWIHQGEIQRIR